MIQPIKIMLVDDSSTMRRLIKTALKSQPNLDVIFEAENGQVAVENVDSVLPDVVVMDVEMPVMDGIVATKEIRKRHPRIPIIMFSSLTSRGAEATMDALAAGASDFASKPAASGHIEAALKQLASDLTPKITRMVAQNRRRSTSVFRQAENSRLRQAPESSSFRLDRKIHMVAIGVSTGGPDALVKLLSNVPLGTSTPILIAQHMPPAFTNLLAQRLASQTGHAVSEAQDRAVIKAGQILIAPGDYHMTVRRSALGIETVLDQSPPENSCRPAADPLFQSVAKCFGSRALGVVLTGMGQDGLKGATELKAKGGCVLAQDEASSVVWGMPRKVVEAGLADATLSLNQIAATIKAAGVRAGALAN